MVAPEVTTKQAIVKLLDELPSDKLVEVLDFVQFLKERKREQSGTASRIEVKTVPASHLKSLLGLISIGGDALEDTERLYDGE